MNEILIYATYVIAICSFGVLIKKLFVFKNNRPAQAGTMPVNDDAAFVNAVFVAIQHGVVNPRLLQRRLKISKKKADELMRMMMEKEIINPMNKHDI